MRAAPLAPLLLAALALAGCSGNEPGGDAPGPAPAEGTGAPGQASVTAPSWSVGDHWTLQPADGEPFRHVVSGDAGDDWVVDTDSPTIAHFDARFDISFLGRVRKADLAGSQGSTRVEFLRFPLHQGLAWQTTWDGEPVGVTVVAVEGGKADLRATRADGTTYAEYTYDARPEYFTRFAFFAPDGATVGFEWTLQQAGAGFSGPLARWQLAELYASTGAIPSGGLTSFSVQGGYTDVWVEGALDCAEGAVALAVGPFTGPAEDRGYSVYGPCPLQEQVAYSIPAPAQAEQWGAATLASPLTNGTWEFHLFGRVAQPVEVGQARPR